eukprot:2624123-Rhodomonas_salina.1
MLSKESGASFHSSGSIPSSPADLRDLNVRIVVLRAVVVGGACCVMFRAESYEIAVSRVLVVSVVALRAFRCNVSRVRDQFVFD